MPRVAPEHSEVNGTCESHAPRVTAARSTTDEDRPDRLAKALARVIEAEIGCPVEAAGDEILPGRCVGEELVDDRGDETGLLLVDEDPAVADRARDCRDGVPDDWQTA